MSGVKSIKQAVTKSSLYTTILTAIFLFFIWEKSSLIEVLYSTLFFIVLYFALFTVGKPAVGDYLRKYIDYSIYKVGVIPAVILLLYYLYLYITGQNPFTDMNMLLPFFILFPVFVFSSKVQVSKNYDWLDFTIFTIFLFPITLITLDTKSDIPLNGTGFDSFYRIMILITAVYAFVVVRGVKDVGFYPEFQLKKLWRAIWVWLLFYSSIFIFAVSVNFLKYKGHDVVDSALFIKIFKKLLTTFLHVALFEELFFRGLLQNMLQKRISQSSNWKTFWIFGAAILFALSLVTGYLMDGGMSYFPALVSLLLFVAAWFIEKAKFDKTGTYTALAISSVIFGLVHYHAGSIIFVGLAAIGGWAYGYTYIKTKNVFYAALVHTLVNTSALMFGLELAK